MKPEIREVYKSLTTISFLEDVHRSFIKDLARKVLKISVLGPASSNLL